jgi:hypothetical protein
MNESVRNNLLTSLLFQNIAEQYLEFTKHETNGDGKAFLNVLIKKADLPPKEIQNNTTHRRVENYLKFQKQNQ